MKTLRILAAFFFATGVAVAQNVNQTEVPSAVKDAFTKEYAKATNVDWEKDMENYKVEFNMDRVDTEVWYNASGTVIKKEQDIAEVKLPQGVRDVIKANYADYRVDDIEKVWQDNATSYDVELEKGNEDKHLTFDATGKVTAEHKH